MSTRDVSNSEDVVNSRDVIERIKELEDEKEQFILDRSTIDEDKSPSWGDVADAQGTAEEDWNDTPEGEELKALLDLQEEAEGYASDWKDGESLIRDSYFEEYARQLAEDIGAINRDAKWPNNCIDWEKAAEELQQDYTSVDWDGVTYWIR